MTEPLEFPLIPMLPPPSQPLGLVCREGKCAQNPKKFEKVYDLTKHMKQHTRPHKCPIEGCRFAEGGNPGGFGQPRDLENHMKTHDPKPSYKCYIAGCTSSATRKDNMVRHLKDQHEVEIKQTEVANLCRCR